MNIAQFINKISDQCCYWRNQIRAAGFLNRRELKEIHLLNRETLNSVPLWISDEVWHGSVFQYGIPDSILHRINDDIGDDITYSDALVVISRTLKKQVRYLEIGVSVGKNFIQMLERLESAQLTGFDIEEINPVLAGKFDMVSTRTWQTQKGSLKTTDSSLTTFTASESTNRIKYLCGDIFDSASWAQLHGEKFNLVFSDAFHSAEAMIYEYDMLTRYDLLDSDEFIIVWDDLGGEMTRVFEQICHNLVQLQQNRKTISFMVPLNGWLGNNEAGHVIGFFVCGHV